MDMSQVRPLLKEMAAGIPGAYTEAGRGPTGLHVKLFVARGLMKPRVVLTVRESESGLFGDVREDEASGAVLSAAMPVAAREDLVPLVDALRAALP